jgi:hypothetical protein
MGMLSTIQNLLFSHLLFKIIEINTQRTIILPVYTHVKFGLSPTGLTQIEGSSGHILGKTLGPIGKLQEAGKKCIMKRSTLGQTEEIQTASRANKPTD